MVALRRGASGLAGILLVDKPVGPTSHDVVSRVRHAFGEKRVGHAGTLDPMASGLLVVLVGPYTRLEPYLSAADKRYEARIVFGSATDTDDAQGTVTETAAIPAGLNDPASARQVLDRFVGTSDQLPPVYSAIKVGGRIAHRAARAGDPLAVAPRRITVHRADLLAVGQDPLAWEVDFAVSKGTYVRALARDIGRSVGSVAHLAALRRTASGPLHVDEALPLHLLCEGPVVFSEVATDPFVALGLPVVDADESSVAHGRSFTNTGADGERVAVRVDGRLAGVYHRTGGRLMPDVVLPIDRIEAS